jgi:hypothetical protein
LNFNLFRLGFFFINLQFIRYFNSLVIVHNNFNAVLVCKKVIFKFFKRVGIYLFTVNLPNEVCLSFPLKIVSYFNSFLQNHSVLHLLFKYKLNR